jgi:protein gp37
MADKSKISWTESTWNPILGCAKVSAGCDNCYAIRDAHRMRSNPNEKVAAAYEGLTVVQNGRPNWSGKVRYLPERLDQPLRWKRPRRIFVNSMSDIAHEDVSQEAFNAILDMMLKADWHTYQVLTKRPERLLRLLEPVLLRADLPDEILPPHIWLGVSVENVKAMERIPPMMQFPSHVAWLSLEPLLEPLPNLPLDGINWVVIGGESGTLNGAHRARPMAEQWVEDILGQCRRARVAAYVKQLGTQWAARYESGHRAGADPAEWPEWLRVREYPENK